MHIADRATLDIFHGKNTAAARRALPRHAHLRAAELLDRLNAAASPNDLRSPASNRLEKLRGDRRGQWSVRINDTYRICFMWDQGEARNVEILDYH
jgi:proteic killer suppression protein